MCNFFSFVTYPDFQPRKIYYFDWSYRKDNLDQDCDTHSGICKYFGLDEDRSNKYEYNPLTRRFIVDQINSSEDDSLFAQEWVENLDFRKIDARLIIKEIVNPFELNPSNCIDMLYMLYQWASVGNSVGDSVGDSVWASIWTSVWAYISSFFSIEYKYDFTSLIVLWETGLVPSFDGQTWRLHTGKNAEIIVEISQDELLNMFE